MSYLYIPLSYYSAWHYFYNLFARFDYIAPGCDGQPSRMGGRNAEKRAIRALPASMPTLGRVMPMLVIQFNGVIIFGLSTDQRQTAASAKPMPWLSHWFLSETSTTIRQPAYHQPQHLMSSSLSPTPYRPRHLPPYLMGHELMSYRPVLSWWLPALVWADTRLSRFQMIR